MNIQISQSDMFYTIIVDKKAPLQHKVKLVNCIYILNIFCNAWSIMNRIDGVMVSMLASSVVDRVFEPQPSKTKDYAIGTSCISNKHAELSSKRKYWVIQFIFLYIFSCNWSYEHTNQSEWYVLYNHSWQKSTTSTSIFIHQEKNIMLFFLGSFLLISLFQDLVLVDALLLPI
jgi:hypothetical protein